MLKIFLHSDYVIKLISCPKITKKKTLTYYSTANVNTLDVTHNVPFLQKFTLFNAPHFLCKENLISLITIALRCSLLKRTS